MLNGPKDCLNLHAGIFVIFFDYYLVVSENLGLFVKVVTRDEKSFFAVKASV